MSYYVDPGPRRGGRRPWLLAVLAAVVVLALGAALLVTRAGPGAHPGGASAAAPALALVWDVVGTQPVPRSAAHGPREAAGGVARGFSHDELGAVLAAINISVRLSADAGPDVYEATGREQCFGDVEAAIAQVRGSRSAAPEGAAVTEAYYYKLTAGDPGGDEVLVSLAVASPQGRGMGGYIGVLRTLRWRDGDWKMQVPAPAAQLIGSVETYTLLGGPRV